MPSAKVAERSLGDRLARGSTLSAITGASLATTATAGAPSRPSRHADEERAVPDRHDHPGRPLAELLGDLAADRVVAVELRRLGAVLEEREPALGGELAREVLRRVEVVADLVQLGAELLEPGRPSARLASAGTNTIARMPVRCAAQAVAAPWLPVEAVTTASVPSVLEALERRQRAAPLEGAELVPVLALQPDRVARAERGGCRFKWGGAIRPHDPERLDSVR